MSGKAKTFIAGAILLCACVGGGVAAYFLMPSESQTVILPAAVPTVAGNSSAAPAAPATGAQAAAAAPAIDDIAIALAGNDETKRQEAIGQLQTLATNDPHALGVGLSKWGPPLLASGNLDDLESLTRTVIERRAMDISTVQAAQRLRVLGLIAQANAIVSQDQKPGYWLTALEQAKGYYNVAALTATAPAANLLAEVLAQAKDAATATEFLQQQAGERTDPAASQPANVYASILGSTTQWDYDIQYLQGRVGKNGASYSSLMCQGEYYLIEDRPDDARKCFDGACQIATSKASQVRNALEAVARAIRDQNGNVAPANAFIESIRDDPNAAAAELIGTSAESPSKSDLQSAARAVKLADLRKLDREPEAVK
jgi:hypothetical protein